MQQLLPLVLDWLSETPDPDLGLLTLRRLTERPDRATQLAATFPSRLNKNFSKLLIPLTLKLSKM
jgi:glutamine synthetase adenylyltransferase